MTNSGAKSLTRSGHVATDSHILFALWLCATLQGVGSGRGVTRLYQAHGGYRWIGDSTSVNHHAVNDFCAGNGTLMDGLLRDNLAARAAHPGGAGAAARDSGDEEASWQQSRGHPGQHRRCASALDADGGWGMRDLAQPSTRSSPPRTQTRRLWAWRRSTRGATDSEAVVSRRVRTASAEAKALHKQRAAIAECVNALSRNRALLRMAGARLDQGALRGGPVCAGAQPGAHGQTGTPRGRLEIVSSEITAQGG